jgi:hypothetical protein
MLDDICPLFHPAPFEISLGVMECFGRYGLPDKKPFVVSILMFHFRQKQGVFRAGSEMGHNGDRFPGPVGGLPSTII